MILLELQNYKDCEINYILDNNEYILDASFIRLDDAILIALLTKPIYSKKQKLQMINNIQKSIYEDLSINKIYITFDTDLFYKINNCNNDNKEKEKIFNEALKRLG